MAQGPRLHLNLANCSRSVPISCVASYSDVISAVVLLRKSIDSHMLVRVWVFKPCVGHQSPVDPCGSVSAINAACCVWRWALQCVNMTLLETTARSDIETRWKIQMSDRQLLSICTSPIAAEVTYKYCGNIRDTIRPTFPVRTVICSMTLFLLRTVPAVRGKGEEQVLLLVKCETDETFKVTVFGKKLGWFLCQEVTTPSVCMLWLWWIYDAYILFCCCRKTVYWYLSFSDSPVYHVPSVLQWYNHFLLFVRL